MPNESGAPPRAGAYEVDLYGIASPQVYACRDRQLSELTKGTYMTQPTHRYMHAVIAICFAGRANNTGMVGQQELYILYSMIEGRPIHLRHTLADFIAHQG